MSETDEIIAQCSINKVSGIHKSDIENLMSQLTQLLDEMPKDFSENMDAEKTFPAAQPPFWIVKWVDYSDKYGFGYKLNDDSIGVTFKDKTRLFMLADGINIRYIEASGQKTCMTDEDYPANLEKKMKLLLFFKRLLTENWISPQKDEAKPPANRISGRMVDKIIQGVIGSDTPIYLNTWFRTTKSTFFHLVNGTVQVDFSANKIFLNAQSMTVTYFDKTFHTYKFSTISKMGCPKNLANGLRYAHEQLGNWV